MAYRNGALILLLFFCLLTAGCAKKMNLTPTGGSRADGTVDLSYEYGVYTVPKVQWEAGLKVAKERCAAWGYDSAEKFGGEVKKCNQSDSYGNCVRWFVTVQYQCTSAGDKPVSPATATSPAPSPAATDIPGQIKKLSELRDQGILTEEEFQKKKQELLDKI